MHDKVATPGPRCWLLESRTQRRPMSSVLCWTLGFHLCFQSPSMGNMYQSACFQSPTPSPYHLFYLHRDLEPKKIFNHVLKRSAFFLAKFLISLTLERTHCIRGLAEMISALVCSGYFNKTPQTGWYLLVTVLETGCLKSGPDEGSLPSCRLFLVSSHGRGRGLGISVGISYNPIHEGFTLVIYGP